VRGPAGARRSRVRLVLREGRKRQVRRMLEAVGHPARRLVRTRVGGLQLGTLPPGAARPLDANELERLRALVGLDGEASDGAEGDTDETRSDEGALDASDVDARSGTPISSPQPPERPRERLPDDRSRPIPPDPDETESLARSIAIDGPTAAGKSVAGRAIAEALGVGFFDTGLMYRACTLAVRRADVDPEDAPAVTELVRALDLDMRWPDPATPEILLADENVTPLLREPDIEATVSLISRIPEVRDEMVRRQRGLAARSPVVMAGRDIGTRVLVEARAKFFLDASSEVRARRRLGEEREAGRPSSFDDVLSQTRRRDELDQTGHRAIRREQAAADAIVVDTDALGIDQVVEVCVRAYREANGDSAGDARAARAP
jgi:CMP/dCMP kinase